MKILVVDDDRAVRSGVSLFLTEKGADIESADSFKSALSCLEKYKFDVLIFDIRLGDLTGIDLFKKIQSQTNDTPVIFISSGASLSEVAEVMRLGAFDFIEKPFSNEKLFTSIHNALLINELKLRKELDKASEFTMLGEAPQFKELKRQIQQVGRTQTTALILGESGTGKELVAQSIHSSSKRALKRFIKVNCSAIPENLIESELFGHEKGAFTGAEASKKGFFELANGGSLFLDEIGDMSLSAQAKVLRALQDSEIQKLGSEKIIKVDVRIIAATNKDLEKGVKEGWFREDLFFRINVFPIKTIPLRERVQDIPVLVDHFLDEFLKENSLPKKRVNPEIFSILKNHTWPGNIRELKNVVERLAIVSQGVITENHLSPFFKTEVENIGASLSLKDFKDQSERKYLIACLKRHQGVISSAAKELGIERTYLHRKISQFEITKKEYLI